MKTEYQIQELERLFAISRNRIRRITRFGVEISAREEFYLISTVYRPNEIKCIIDQMEKIKELTESIQEEAELLLAKKLEEKDSKSSN